MTPWLVLSRIFTVSVWGCISRQFREVVGDTAPFLLRVYWQKDEDMLSQGDQRCWNVDFIRSRVRFNPRQLAARVKDDIRCGQWNLRIQPLEFRDLSNGEISKRWTKTSHRLEFNKLDVLPCSPIESYRHLGKQHQRWYQIFDLVMWSSWFLVSSGYDSWLQICIPGSWQVRRKETSRWVDTGGSVKLGWKYDGNTFQGGNKTWKQVKNQKPFLHHLLFVERA